MALQFTYTSQQTGAIVDSAYARVLFGNFDKTHINFQIGIFYNVQASDNNLQALDTFSYRIPMPPTASVSGLYTYLKTLPEFANAIDV